MASPTQWTWVWVGSGSWWWTGRPGVLQFMGSQRVRLSDWVNKSPEARLKGLEKLIKIRRPELRLSSEGPAHAIILSETPPLTYCYKILIKFSGVEMCNFSMLKCCVSLLAWQSNKAILFYFTQNSSPGIWFCTRVQRGWAFCNNLTSLIDLRIVDFSVCSAFLFVGMEWWLLRPIHAGLEAWSIAPFSLVKKNIKV